MFYGEAFEAGLTLCTLFPTTLLVIHATTTLSYLLYCLRVFPSLLFFPWRVFPVNGKLGKLTSVPLYCRKWFYHEALEGFQYTGTETSFPGQNMVMFGPSGSNLYFLRAVLPTRLTCLWVSRTALCLTYWCLQLVVVSGKVRLSCSNNLRTLMDSSNQFIPWSYSVGPWWVIRRSVHYTYGALAAGDSVLKHASMIIEN